MKPVVSLRRASRWVWQHIDWRDVVSALLVLAIVAVIGGGVALLRGDPTREPKAIVRTPAEPIPPTTRGAGQIEGGNILRAKNVTAQDAEFELRKAVAVKPQDQVLLRLRLHNVGPSEMPSATVKVLTGQRAANSLAVEATVTSEFTPEELAASDAATVEMREQAFCLMLDPGTTRVLDGNGGTIENLPDTIHSTGVEVKRISVGVDPLKLVEFSATARVAHQGAQCE